MSVIVPGHAYGALHGYWGQKGPAEDRLANYCDTGIEYVAVAFVNSAPENEASGYPSINFSTHCWADAYENEDGVPSNLLSECRTLQQDITYCQQQGVKVILSIGGVYDEIDSNYLVETEENGEDFADFLYGAFGPKTEEWTGPRPFDFDDENPTVVDGFDFDIEEYFDNYPYIAMIERFRELDSNLIITGAPECPTNPLFFKMQEMIEEAHFDALFVQFYNNPSCDARSVLPGDPFDTFNYRQWETVLRNSARSQDAKIFVGLPGRPDAARNGYVEPEVVKDIVCEYHDSEFWGGIGIWDLWYAGTNVVGEKTFLEHVIDALDYGCNPVPTTTTTTTSVSSTSTSSSSSETSSSESTTTTTSAGNSTTTSSSTSASVTSTSATLTSETSETSGTVSSTSTGGNLPTGLPTGGWNTTMTTRSTEGPSEPTTTLTTEGPSEPTMTTRTEYTTRTRTITDCPPYVEDCPEHGYTTTEVIPIYTTVCPIDELPPKPTGVPCDGDCPGDDEPGHDGPGHDGPGKLGHDGECDGECPGHDGPGKPGHDEPEKPDHDEPEKPGHDDEPCYGPHCPGHDEPEKPGHDEPEKPGHDDEPCTGPHCPGHEEPTKIVTTIHTTLTVPGGGETVSTMTTTKVPGAPQPTGGWTSAPPAAEPTAPIEGGAAGLSVGMSVLAAVLAFQLL